VTDAGHTSGWNSYVDFAGCPQDDDVGRNLLDLVSASGANETITASLIVVWIDEFADCGYAPLNAWILSAIGDLASLNGHGLGRAILGLPPVLDSALADRLQQLASDPGTPTYARNEVADALLSRLAPEAASATFVEVLASPGLNEDFVALWSANFIQLLGGDFLSSLSAAAGPIDDATLSTVLGVTLTVLGSGGLSFDDPAVGDLIQALEGRPALASALEMFEGTIVYASFQSVRDHIQNLVAQGRLTEEHQTGLETVLQQAENAFEADRPSAIPLLEAFTSEVEGLVSGGQLSPLGAQPLLDGAAQAIAVLNG